MEHGDAGFGSDCEDLMIADTILFGIPTNFRYFSSTTCSINWMRTTLRLFLQRQTQLRPSVFGFSVTALAELETTREQ